MCTYYGHMHKTIRKKRSDCIWCTTSSENYAKKQKLHKRNRQQQHEDE